MKRDKDLIRRLIRRLHSGGTMKDISDEKIGYHAELLLQSGWVNGTILCLDNGPYLAENFALTHKGHEVADLLDDGTWDEIKRNGLISLPFEKIIEYAKEKTH